MATASLSPLETIQAISSRKAHELTKSDEIMMLRAFMELVPKHTYLADYLDRADETFESDIRSDIMYPRWDHIEAKRREMEEATQRYRDEMVRVREAQAKLKQAQQELADMQRQAASIINGISDLKDKFDTLEWQSSRIGK
ncbi:MAG: hypothetical protein NXI32_04945 [bacterium]|nr:hypothetical protein [bacterium]